MESIVHPFRFEASTSSKSSDPKMVAYTLVSHRMFIPPMLEMMVGDKDD